MRTPWLILYIQGAVHSSDFYETNPYQINFLDLPCKHLERRWECVQDHRTFQSSQQTRCALSPVPKQIHRREKQYQVDVF